MNRRNTNFPSQLNSRLETFLSERSDKNGLKYYQELVAECLKTNASKGLYLYHHMGFGKTIASYHIINKLGMKTIVIAPKALIHNFRDSLKKYEQISGEKIDPNLINFVKLSHTTEKQMSLLDPDNSIDPFQLDDKAEKITQLKNLDGYLILIDEAHMFCRRISHGSQAMIRLYDLLNTSNCKIVMLSGSLIASSPFELSPIINLLSGETLFPETEEQFNQFYLDENRIANRALFQNRIYGLISRMKPEYLDNKDKDLYPEELETKIIRLPMDMNHFSSYLRVRDVEVKGSKGLKSFTSSNVNRFQSSGKDSGSYRIRSRQMSNARTNADIEQMYKSNEYTQSSLIDLVFRMPLEELSVNKTLYLETIFKNHPGQKGIIYTNFVGVGGAANIAAYLNLTGWTERKISEPIKKGTTTRQGHSVAGKKGTTRQGQKGATRQGQNFNDKKQNVADKKQNATDKEKNVIGKGQSVVASQNLSSKIYSRVNGSLTQEEQTEILDLYANNKINLLVIGLEQTMGLDLTCVRYAVMFEPYWKDFIFEQFKYRAIRLNSHMSLPKEDRNVQMYILLSTYPESFDKSKLPMDYDLTTDEYIYEQMVRNKELLSSFKEAIEEVSIECDIVKQYGTSGHKCRTCAPNDLYLYTSGDPIKSIINDLGRDDPCITDKKKQSVSAKIIIINKIEYYVVKSDANIWGFIIYIKDGGYIEIPTNSPVYKIIAKKNKT